MTQSSQYGEASASASASASLVLIVEDEPMIRDFVQEILEFEGGFRTESVENADQALEYLQNHAHEVSLLLTDVRMPGSMDGIALANLVAGKWPAMPIVVMSGHGTPGSDQLPPDVLFIAKPWTITQLLDGVCGKISASGAHSSETASQSR
ncbi:response regulator [Pseudomonas syringae]|uniref:response regulator n=1 Tax=Pseudomonas syringae TaxID=317 RepID=UPI000517938D|nr:response regulator [Pseudomonas syringae]